MMKELEETSEMFSKTSLDFIMEDIDNPIETISTNLRTAQKEIHSPPIKEQFCRICGSVSDHCNLIDIFGKRGDELRLQESISFHLHLQVERSDQLPLQICVPCSSQLNMCQRFYETCKAADLKLHQIFVTKTSTMALTPTETKRDIHELEQDCADSNISEFEIEKKDSNKCNSAEYIKTQKKNLQGASLLCHICGKHFKHSANLHAHKRTHLAESVKKKHHCSMCSKSFRSKFHLSEHMNVHSGKAPYNCPKCHKSFHKRAQLRQHTLVHSDDSEKIGCPVCGLRFNRRGNLQAHMKIHSENRTFECRLCQQQLPTFSDLLSHRKQHTQEDIKNRLSLNLIRDKEQILTCQICNKIFTDKRFLASHLEKHNSQDAGGKFNCPVCGKILNSHSSLIYHQRSQHSGDRPFHCSFCTKGFMSRKLLQAHENKHTGEKPFKCEICWKAFRSRNNLSQHLLKHNSEKKFVCSICEKKFSRKGALNIHLRKHTGEKPFICDLCGRPFGQKNDMLRHQKTHLEPNTKTQTCDQCLVVFNSRKELCKHKEIAHNDSSVNLVPLIITNNMYETHIITEDGQKIVFAAVETLEENNPISNVSSI